MTSRILTEVVRAALVMVGVVLVLTFFDQSQWRDDKSGGVLVAKAAIITVVAYLASRMTDLVSTRKAAPTKPGEPTQ